MTGLKGFLWKDEMTCLIISIDSEWLLAFNLIGFVSVNVFSNVAFLSNFAFLFVGLLPTLHIF